MSSEMTADAGVPMAQSHGLNQVERVVDTFVAPSKTFSDILRSTSWWMPFLLMVLSICGTAWVTGHQVGWDRVYQNTISQSPKTEDRMNQMEPAQKAKAMEMGAKITAGITYALPVLFLIFYALYALIVWAAFNFGLGAKTTFGQVFAVTWYSALPYLLLGVLTILTLYFGNTEAFDQKYPVGTNLAYFMPDASPWVRALLGQLDVIRLWGLGLMVYGMAVISKKSVMQSAVVVVTIWAFTVLLTTVGAAFS